MNNNPPMQEPNEQKPALRETTNAIITQVIRKTALLVVLAIGAAFLAGMRAPGEPWWSFPGGILFGAGLGLANFHWLAKTVERFYVKNDYSPATTKMIGWIVTGIKLSAIFIILFIFIKWQVFNILGLVIGLSLCFLAIIWQGIASVARLPKRQ